MQKLIMLAGPSGSGKSTYATKLYDTMTWAKNYGIVIISSDAIRGELYGDESDQTDPQRVFDVAYGRILKHLDEGASVIFDATNLNPTFRSHLLGLVKSNRAVIELHYMMADTPTCMERMAVRERKVPGLVMMRQLNMRQRDLERGAHEFFEEGFDIIKFVKT